MSLAEGTWASPRWQAVFCSSLIGLALSIWLIFGSRGIARFVLWVRTAGVNSGGVNSGGVNSGGVNSGGESPDAE